MRFNSCYNQHSVTFKNVNCNKGMVIPCKRNFRQFLLYSF